MLFEFCTFLYFYIKFSLPEISFGLFVYRLYVSAPKSQIHRVIVVRSSYTVTVITLRKCNDIIKTKWHQVYCKIFVTI